VPSSHSAQLVGGVARIDWFDGESETLDQRCTGVDVPHLPAQRVDTRVGTGEVLTQRAPGGLVRGEEPDNEIRYAHVNPSCHFGPESLGLAQDGPVEHLGEEARCLLEVRDHAADVGEPSRTIGARRRPLAVQLRLMVGILGELEIAAFEEVAVQTVFATRPAVRVTP